MDIDNEFIANLPGGPYRPEELRFMSGLLSTTRGLGGSYLEVGSLAGRSSIVIGREAKENESRLFCIDIWNSGEWAIIADEIGISASRYPSRPRDIHSRFTDNIKRFKLQDTVIPIMDRSESVIKGWSAPLRFVHIDGCHEYEFVKRDTEWKNHLVKGGIICFHDYSEAWLGVKQAVDESFNSDKQFKGGGSVASLLAFRKVN